MTPVTDPPAATDLPPLETLYEMPLGDDLPLPPALAAVYGRLQFPPHPGRPYVCANFVSSLDGVVTLDTPGQRGGGAISGFNRHDRMVMGLLRSVADAVVVGAGTLRVTSNVLYTAANVFPPLAEAYAALRRELGKPGPPLNVVVSASGELDPGQRIFQSGEVPALVVTTPRGAARLRERNLPLKVQIAAAESEGPFGTRAILDAVGRVRPSDLVLLEGGPHLLAGFLAEGTLDELFLTLAPQVAGRLDGPDRPAFAAGRVFAPEQPVWGMLVGLKRGESHLFLRYSFTPP